MIEQLERSSISTLSTRVLQIPVNAARAFSGSAARDDAQKPNSDTAATNTIELSNIEQQQTRELWLLACMPESRGGRSLHQVTIQDIRHDQELFGFIQDHLSGSDESHWLAKPLKKATGVSFTKASVLLRTCYLLEVV